MEFGDRVIVSIPKYFKNSIQLYEEVQGKCGNICGFHENGFVLVLLEESGLVLPFDITCLRKEVKSLKREIEIDMYIAMEKLNKALDDGDFEEAKRQGKIYGQLSEKL